MDSGTHLPPAEIKKSRLEEAPETQTNTLLVCWLCEKAWNADDWDYCPECAADLVEVEKA